MIPNRFSNGHWEEEGEEDPWGEQRGVGNKIGPPVKAVSGPPWRKDLSWPSMRQHDRTD